MRDSHVIVGVFMPWLLFYLDLRYDLCQVDKEWIANACCQWDLESPQNKALGKSVRVFPGESNVLMSGKSKDLPLPAASNI